jgi:choline dehydrogenase-like flavoprotein
MAKYELSDDSVVVIIGSGAGGGTLANELCQKGVNVVLLEAGKRESIDTFVNDEWASFLQLAWLDKRTTSGTWRVARDFPNLPTWICKTVGGTTTHWAGASLRIQEHEFRAKTVYGEVAGANLEDWPVQLAELEPYYARAEDKMGVTRTNGMPGLPGNNNFKVFYTGAKRAGYKHVNTGHMAINSVPRGDRPSCQQIGFCFQGCKSAAKWSTLYTEIPTPRRRAGSTSGRSRTRSGSSTTPRARSPGSSTRTPPASSTSRRRGWSASPATRSRARGCCSTRPRPSSRTGWRTARARSAATTCGT